MLLQTSMQVSPRLLGLALGQVLNLSGTMQWCGPPLTLQSQYHPSLCP